MIPKTIHYCWFGGNEKPEKIQKCIESWKRFLPEYEIIEWSEKSLDIMLTIYQNKFASEAYKQKRYAFVSDYVRAKVLYELGGIYMDADVEVLKPLDKFLHHRAFTGHETNELTVTAIMGAEKNHPWIKKILDYYKDICYNIEEEIPNTNIITDISKSLICWKKNDYAVLENDVHIYPIEIFCPFNHLELKPTPTDNSYAIHWFEGSWTKRNKGGF
jgi:mannosyltransferase OCH1-like enzyme